jgi:hypothetical protein
MTEQNLNYINTKTNPNTLEADTPDVFAAISKQILYKSLNHMEATTRCNSIANTSLYFFSGDS